MAKKTSAKAQRPIRMGVVGLGRGMSFAASAPGVGMKLVAVCERRKEKLDAALQRFPGVKGYADYDEFLSHEMDAVILANYFHQHAPFAIKALQAGLHVMSETSACKTIGEGVALARAVEESGKIYMLAENYCYMAAVQELRRLYRADEIGDLRFAECAYNHPCDDTTLNALSPGVNHWRNWIPSTYYCTHALAPIMYITDTRPLGVNAQSIPYSERQEHMNHVRRGDPGSCILCRMDNGAVVHVFGLQLRGHATWYRLHGSRGVMEKTRHAPEGLRVLHEPWDMRPGDVREKFYRPEFPEHAQQAARAGHGGGDFFTNYHFARAIRTGRQPWLNVYRALDMTLVGIQAWRSCLKNGDHFEVPDLRKKSVRKRYENDHWSPFAEHQGPGAPPPSILGIRQPTARQFAAARKVWKSMGHRGP